MEFFLIILNKALLIGVLVSFLVFYFVFWRFRSSKIDAAKSPSPPEVDGGLPIIGHLHLLRNSEPFHLILADFADKYGPAFTIKLGQYPALILSSWELAKEVFTTNDKAVLSRPTFMVSKHLSYDNAMFNFSPYGPYWRDIRKLVAQELLSARRIEMLKHIQVSEVETSIKELYNLWKENEESSSSHVLVEMRQWFGDLTLNVILRTIVGKRYFGSVDASEEKEARRCQEVLKELTRALGLFLVSDSIPFLRWFDWSYERKLKAFGKELDQIVQKWLNEHLLKKESGEANGGDHQDFMDVMTSLVEGAQIAGGYDADTITKATCIVLISGGSNTTAAILTWAITLLVNNQKVLRKAQEEVDLIVGKERQVKESDINKLVYIQAIIKETLRLYPALPLSGARVFTEDCTIGGYNIRKGTRLIPNLWKLHRDPTVWNDPLEFKPERFLTTHKNVNVKGHHFELIPFGSGRRICPGTDFAVQNLNLVLASFLHAFDVSNPSAEPIDMSETVGFINYKVTPLQLLLAPRLPPAVY